MSDLNEELANVLDVTPHLNENNVEEYDEVNLQAKLLTKGHSEVDKELPVIDVRRNFRSQTEDLFADDKRYTSKKIHRFQTEDSTVDQQVSSKVNDEVLSDLSSDYSSSNDDNVNEKSLEDSQSPNHSEQSDVENDDDLKNIPLFSTKETDAVTEKTNSKCLANQLKFWNNILEIRIKLQPLLSSAMKLPFEKDLVCKLKKHEENKKLLTECKSLLNSVMNDFLNIYATMFSSCTEGDENDEEIISSEDETEETESSSLKVSRKRPYSSMSKDLVENHEILCESRKSVLDYWDQRTKLSLSKKQSDSFDAFNQSTNRQIEQIVGHSDRLLARTKIARTEQKIIGLEQDPSPSSHVEIFDDLDFYQTILQELISKKTANITDPQLLGKHWAVVNSLRKKIKKDKVDTRASKGRKIRYDIHQKLVSFMASNDTSSLAWSDTARTELFRSLFDREIDVREAKSDSMNDISIFSSH